MKTILHILLYRVATSVAELCVVYKVVKVTAKIVECGRIK